MGGLQIRIGEAVPIRFAARRAQVLLTYLAYQPAPVARADLAKFFFEDRETSQAMANLRSLFAQLPKEVKPFLDLGRKQVSCLPGLVELDARRLEDELAAAIDPIDRTETLERYRGDFLSGVFIRDSQAIESWIYRQRENLRQLVLDNHEVLAFHYFYNQNYARALSHASALIRTDPLRESYYRLQIRILARSGQPVAALEQYEACQRMMEEEFGAEPEPATLQLRARVEALRRRSRANLPGLLTPFVGRQVEMAELDERLDHPDQRLMTLIGPGGSGKTRLGTELAKRVQSDYLDGVAFVPFADIDDAAEIPRAVASALDIKLSGSKTSLEQVLDVLASQEMLIVLDNLEHLLPAARAPIQRLLSGALALTLLVTSRRPLGIENESVYPLGGLAFVSGGDAQDDAAQLFALSARRGLADFGITPANREAIQHICRLLDGLPLAIELAAGWSTILSPAEIAAELEAGLDVLESQIFGRPDRHQSLHAVFDYSWNYLSEIERLALQQLAGFRGGFSAEAANRIAGIKTVTIRGLVSHSLLQEQPDLERYQVLTVLRQYLAEKIPMSAAELADFREAHRNYYSELLGSASSAETEPPLPLELENARLAWQSGADASEAGALSDMLEALVAHYLFRGPFSDMSRLLGLAAEALVDEVNRVTRAKLLSEQARFLVLQGSYEPAAAAATQAVAGESTAELEPIFARAYLHWGQSLQAQGHYDEANEQYERSGDLAVNSGAFDIQADSLRGLGIVASFRGDYPAARAFFSQSLEIYQTLGDPYGEAGAFINLGLNAKNLGDLELAEDYYLLALEINDVLGDELSRSKIFNNLGVVSRIRGDYGRARRYFTEAIDLKAALGDDYGRGLALNNLANIASRIGHYETARISFEEALMINRKLGHQRMEGMLHSNLALLLHLNGQDEAGDRQARQAIELAERTGDRPTEAFARTHLGHTLVARGQHAEAVAEYESARALRTADESHLVAEADAGLARAFLASGQLPRAVALVNELLTELDERGVEGAEEPFRILLTCVETLAAAEDERADNLLDQAVENLQLAAAKIADPDDRSSYLEHVPTHRRLLELAQR